MTTEATVLSIDEAARYLNVSKPTLYRLLDKGAVRGLKAGNRWRFRPADLSAYLERGPVAQFSAPVAVVGPEVDYFAAEIEALDSSLKATVELSDAESESPDELAIGRLCDGIVRFAIAKRASDIHLDSLRDATDSSIRVRYRIDGILHDIRRIPIAARDGVVAHFKHIADMDPAERALPQDGRVPMRIGERSFDLRVSAIPSLNGESITIRILSTENVIIDLTRLGFAPDDDTAVRAMLANPYGMILTSGPTGSGKTTILYSCIREVATDQVKVVSIEDPVEHALPGVVQVGVSNAMNFAAAMRAVLNQDPDVIAIGEIRDRVTMDLCVQAASTGHLVLSQLHTNGAAETVVRLIDLGTSPFLIPSVLKGIISVRLVRRLCPKCREVIPAWCRDTLRNRLIARAIEGGWTTPPNAVFYQSKGCVECTGGYRERMAIYEVLSVGDLVSGAIAGGKDAAEITHAAIASGMTTLVADGVRKAAEGLTSLDEIARVLPDPDR